MWGNFPSDEVGRPYTQFVGLTRKRIVYVSSLKNRPVKNCYASVSMLGILLRKHLIEEQEEGGTSHGPWRWH
jgi:hypothetical protein